MNLGATFTELDLLIKEGKSAQAKKLFLSIDFNQIPRGDRVKLAQIARRLNLPTQILKLLSPYVRPSVKNFYKPTVEEAALYAVGLTRLGAYREALKNLLSLDAADFPQVNLFVAHVYIFKWDYEGAIPFLQSYLQALSDPYQKLVARLNLAAAFLHVGRMSQFLTLVKELISEAEAHSQNLILANSLELLSQYYILEKSYQLASDAIERAEELLKDSASVYSFFVKKWRFLIDLLKQGSNSQNFIASEKFKAEALKLREWESIRECDFYLSIATNDADLCQYVYRGTSLGGYKKKMRRISKIARDPDAGFLWIVPDVNRPFSSNKLVPSLNFDLARGKLREVRGGSKDSLLDHPKLHKLLQILCLDFYRPVQIGEAFYQLYPDEYYSWQTSPDRVLQIVKRLRWWFDTHEVPLTVAVQKSNLVLRSLQPVSILMSSKRKISNSTEERWLAVTENLNHSEFCLPEISAKLHISERSARRILSWAKEKGLVRGGRGSGKKKYQLITKTKAA